MVRNPVFLGDIRGNDASWLVTSIDKAVFRVGTVFTGVRANIVAGACA
jgi:hypothetical protein